MNNRDAPETPPTSRDDNELERLLRTAGPRLGVPVDRAMRVRQSAHQAWQEDVRRRMNRRRMAIGIALLSTAATAAVVVRVALPAKDSVPARDVTVATVERADGAVQAFAEGSSNGTIARTLAPDAPVHAGEWVATAATTRAALRLGNGASVRLDTDSRARLFSAMVIELIEGALYIDTGHDSTGLEVRTPLGTARDIGTQFEVRVGDASIRVRVRDGVVELLRGDRTMSAHRGTELTVTAGNAVSEPISPFGPEWNWVASLAPPFEIDGRPLAAFLEAISREHGWTVRYADAGIAGDAADITLHGSVRGLGPHDAVAVTLTTSGLDHRFEGGDLVVFRAADQGGDAERP